MARLLVALIAAAAFAILLIVPDDASARAGAARGARPVGIHHGGAAIIVRRPAVHHRGVAWRRGLAIRHRATFGGPALGFGVGMDEAAAGPGQGLGGSGCYWERMQIDDDYGWRVRDVMVCPPGSGGSVGQPAALPK